MPGKGPGIGVRYYCQRERVGEEVWVDQGGHAQDLLNSARGGYSMQHKVRENLFHLLSHSPPTFLPDLSSFNPALKFLEASDYGHTISLESMPRVLPGGRQRLC